MNSSPSRGTQSRRRKHYLLPTLSLALAMAAAIIGQQNWRIYDSEQPVYRASVRPNGLNRMEETGKRVYASICAYCHGTEGDGFGLNSSNLATPPRAHTDEAYMAALADAELFNVIKLGGASRGKSPLMPAWGGRLNDREITALVAFLRTLSRKPKPNPTPGQ